MVKKRSQGTSGKAPSSTGYTGWQPTAISMPIIARRSDLSEKENPSSHTVHNGIRGNDETKNWIMYVDQRVSYLSRIRQGHKCPERYLQPPEIPHARPCPVLPREAGNRAIHPPHLKSELAIAGFFGGNPHEHPSPIKNLADEMRPWSH